MALLHTLCICGVIFVGASSCVGGPVLNDTFRSPDFKLIGMTVDSQNNFWLFPYSNSVMRCDDSWRCTDVVGDWARPAAMAVPGNGSVVYLQERVAAGGKTMKGQPYLKKCIQEEDGMFSCSVLTHQHPSKLAIDAQGNLLSVMAGEQVQQWTPEGTVFVGPEVSCEPDEMTVDLHGNLFVLCYHNRGSNTSVKKCNQLDDCLDIHTITDNTGSLAVGPDDFLYMLPCDDHEVTTELIRCSPNDDCENFSIEDWVDRSHPCGGIGSLTVDQKGDIYLWTSLFGLVRFCLPAPPDPAPMPDPSPAPAPDPAPVPAPAPGPAPVPAVGTHIISNLSSLCVDLPGGDTSNGALLWMWECYDGATQQWSFQDGQLVYLPDTSKCVDLLGGDSANGNKLGIWDCYEGDSQLWGFDPEWGTIYLASSKASDATKCAQIAGDNVGDPLVIWDCTIEPTQVWTVGPVSDVWSSLAVV